MASQHNTIIKPFILVLLLLISTSFSKRHPCLTEQQNALLQFKETTHYDPGLDDYYYYYYYGSRRTVSWPNDTDCCMWDGVTCDNITGDVISLDVSFASLEGTINNSSPLFRLQNLQSLNLSFNLLSGSLSAFTHLPKLLHLDLSFNSFNGTIDRNSSLFLQHLHSLNLSYNSLSGSLNFFFFQLPNLVHLGLSFNSFNGSIPLDISYSTVKSTTNNSSSLFTLQNLQSLDLSYNYLSGSLDFSFFQFPKLLRLDLSYNEFDGTIYSNNSLFLQNLQSLRVSGNHLSGSLNFFFFQLPNLVHLDLSDNSFNGSFPFDISYGTLKSPTNNSSSLFPLQNLQSLDLSFNELSCIIPNEFAHLSQLISLDISGNKFAFTNSLLDSLIQNMPQIQELSLNHIGVDGDFPSSLPTKVRSLTLGNCSLKGKIPDYIFRLPNLQFLDVSKNLGLIGTLPNFNWSSPLISLDLASTGLSGNIPKSIGNLKNLKHLNLHSCHFTSLIPSSICSLSTLQMLLLSGNKFSGLIPKCLGNLTDLQSLDVSDNQLIGPLPGSLNNCTLLEHMNVSFNMLYDTFPYWLNHLSNLNDVDLGHNRFHGPLGRFFTGSMLSVVVLRQNYFSNHLPDFYGNLSLGVLDLSSNSLEGPMRSLPQVFGLLTLANNKFTGKIPQSICKLRIAILDLSNNSLTGTIPPCMLNRTDDFGYIIKLGMNRLEGAIPDVFAKNNNIPTLELSGNQLRGPLPRSLVNCKKLVLLDLSNNNIEDSFPYWLGTLPQLQVLILHSNRFNGKLKTMMDHPFPSLRVFDISSNNLTGLLPIEFISQLHAMKSANNPEEGLWYLEGDTFDVSAATVSSLDILRITLTMKGSRFDFPKILQEMTLVDFSNNNFQGEIPEVIGELIKLKGLSLSHNNLTGSIPLSIQNLTNLEWLDLSSNKLQGQIPSGLAHLTELESLNLSYNELKGMIPKGPQLDTFGLESFVGNMGLCGPQVAKACLPDILEQPQLPLRPIEEDDFSIFDWKIILMGYGCGLIIGISIGYMVFELRTPKWFVLLVEEKLLKKIAKSSRWRT